MEGNDPGDDLISKGGGVFQAGLMVNTHHAEIGIYT